MKTLKTIITVFLLFQTTVSFGQTKEETISWLKDKLEKHLMPFQYDKETIKDVRLISIDACQFIVSSTGTLKDDGSVHKYLETFPIKNDSLSSDGYFKYTGDKILFERDGVKRYRNNSSLYISNAIEEDIIPRVEKALKHLATFCPKKKETF